MLENLKDYLKHQEHWFEAYIESGNTDISPTEAYWLAIGRAVGATELATNCGISFEIAEAFYEETRKKLDELISR